MPTKSPKTIADEIAKPLKHFAADRSGIDLDINNSAEMKYAEEWVAKSAADNPIEGRLVGKKQRVKSNRKPIRKRPSPSARPLDWKCSVANWLGFV